MNSLGCRPVRSVGLAIIVGLGFSQPSFCATYPLINIDPSTQVSQSPGPGQYQGFNEAHLNAMIGYTFYLRQVTTITQVGWYDDGRDGLSRDFQVGLWHDLSGATAWPYIDPNNSVQLLGNPSSGLTIPAGTSTSLNGVWRVVDIAPLTLQPGGYELAGLDTSTTPDVTKYVFLVNYPVGPQPPSLGLTYGSPVEGSFMEPSGFHVSSQFLLVWGLELGPMLFSNVPEPSTLALGGLSALALLFRQRRRL